MIPYEFDAERFSRWMSYVLRHNPARYGLQPDRHGYVDFDEFFRIATRRYPQVPAERLRELIETSGAGRFELSGNRLRARYGHSIPVEPSGAPVEPPPQLYHGTGADEAQAILRDGLAPIDRRMVHLSETVEDAIAVARHKTSQPVVLGVLAQDAHRSGIPFYHEGKVYLAARIPPEFLKRVASPELSIPPT